MKSLYFIFQYYFSYTNNNNTSKVNLLLSSKVKSTLLKRTTAIMNLDNISISTQYSTLSQLNIFLSRVLGKTPLETLKNLLPTSELELTTTNRLNTLWFMLILSTH